MPLFRKKAPRAPKQLAAIGGLKYAKTRRNRGLGLIFPRSPLMGGVPIEKITLVKYLGGETEVNADLVDVTFRSKKGKEHTLRMVRKTFHTVRKQNYFSKHNPPLQLEVMNELIELNRTKKLGLHLPKTVRLIVNADSWQLLTNHVPTISNYELLKTFTRADWDRYNADVDHQIKILHENGFGLEEGPFQFQPALDPATKRPYAALVDFGGIIKMADFKRYYRHSSEVVRVSLKKKMRSVLNKLGIRKS